MNLKDLEIKNLPVETLKGEDIFGGKRVVVFGLPGAFTPTCSSQHAPGFQLNYDNIIAEGIDEIYCTSVNDGFVMQMWMPSYEPVKYLADGNGDLADVLGMLVSKSNLGFGVRTWRYAAVINDGMVECMFQEPGIEDNCETDPFGVSTAENILEYLKEVPMSEFKLMQESINND